LAQPLRTVNLTTEGTRDWAHWGLATNTLFNHKANVSQQISDFTKIGSDPVTIYRDNYTAYSWTDGTPAPNASSLSNGVFTTGVTNGFQITVPADTTARRLRVYVGLYGAQGNFQAWLSDFSAAAYLDTTLSNTFDNAYGVYTLNYAAASAGQTLTLRYRSLKLFDFDFGNVTLQAATLVMNPGSNLPPTITIDSPTNGAVLTAPATFTLQASATDIDGGIAQVEFFKANTSLGVDTTSPYSTVVSNLAAGSYTFFAVATDNLGAKATNSISILVNNPPTVSLSSPTNGASFVAPANILLAALASDTDGSVTKVEFFEGTNKLGEDLTDPYSLTWSNVAAGTYSLTAKATDDRGATTSSSAVTISVTNGPAATVTLSNPTWSGSQCTFSFSSEVGHSYIVEWSGTLATNSWQVLTNFSGSGSTIVVTDGDVSAGQKFYRLKIN
jgi:hypothetical protein